MNGIIDLRALLCALCLAGLSTPALAADCPPFYRFVDFGIAGEDGQLYRGGPVFRAEDFDGTPLLFTRSTDCADVADVLKDGRGNPIPVVTKIAYDRRDTDPALGWVEVAAVDDAAARALQVSQVFQDAIAAGQVDQIRGADFLCLMVDATTLGCQVVSPYPNDAPLVVYCEVGECIAFAIAMTDRLVISASWPAPDGAVAEQGAAVAGHVRDIATFLAPISSGL